MKVRIRWYGDLFGYVEKPILEKKTQPGVRIVSHQFKIYSWKIEDEQNTSHDSDIQIFLYRLPQK